MPTQRAVKNESDGSRSSGARISRRCPAATARYTHALGSGQAATEWRFCRTMRRADHGGERAKCVSRELARLAPLRALTAETNGDISGAAATLDLKGGGHHGGRLSSREVCFFPQPRHEINEGMVAVDSRHLSREAMNLCGRTSSACLLEAGKEGLP